MTDLIEEAAKLAYDTDGSTYGKTWESAKETTRHFYRTLALAQRDFWVARIKPEDAMPTVLRKAASGVIRHGYDPAADQLHILLDVANYLTEIADRLETAQRNRERDIRIGRRWCNIHQVSSVRTDDEFADLGKHARLAVEQVRE